MGNCSFASLILVPLSILLGSSCQSAPKEKPLAQREPAAAVEAEEAHWSGVLAEYQKWTFGCSTEHPEENKTPEL